MTQHHSSSLAESVDATTLGGLDGLRALAVSLVVFSHYGPSLVPGAYGVVLFFVLSGFLITRLLLREQRLSGGISLKRFYARRSLRIFPAFYVYWFGVVGLLLVTGRAVPWDHAWSAFAYLSNYYNALHGDPNTGFSHTWSLAAEEQFYLLWPLGLIFLTRARRNVLGILSAVIVGIWLMRFMMVYVFQLPQSYLYASFETRADALLLGCALAIAVARPEIANRLQRFVGHWSAGWLALASTIGIASLAAAIGTTAFRDTIVWLVLPLVLGVLLLHVVATPTSALSRVLDLGPVRYVGRISYGMYLYQQILSSPVHHLTEGLPYVVQLSFMYALTVLFATLSFFVVERPFLRWKERFSVPKARSVEREGDSEGEGRSFDDGRLASLPV